MLKKIILSQILLFCLVSFSQKKKTCTKKSSVYDINTVVSKCSKNKVDKNATRTRISRSFIRRKINTDVIKSIAAKKEVEVKKEVVNDLNAIKSAISLATLSTDTPNVKNLELNNVIDKVPFSVVDEKPIFKKCADTETTEQSKCFISEIYKHVQRHFSYPENSLNKRIQGRVFTKFLIDENGNITDIFAAGPEGTTELEKEAIRIIKKIPKFVSPGKISGNPVKVMYGLPINFKLD